MLSTGYCVTVASRPLSRVELEVTGSRTLPRPRGAVHPHLRSAGDVRNAEGESAMSMKAWLATEKGICKLLGKKHIGGPGMPDCRGGGVVVEVKHQQRAVNRSQVKDTLGKPWAHDKPVIMTSTSGFTPGARRLAYRYDDRSEEHTSEL